MLLVTLYPGTPAFLFGELLNSICMSSVRWLVMHDVVVNAHSIYMAAIITFWFGEPVNHETRVILWNLFHDLEWSDCT
jgi:hypothetical protein